MQFDLSHFHFLRPELLLLLIPAISLLYLARQNANKQSSWQKVISPHLLEFLFVKGEEQSASRFPFWLSATLITLLVIAMSGPSFRQKPVPVFESENAQVILVDLSLSMDATDIKPSRLDRAKFKLIDLLNRTKEGTIGLVVYAGDAFVISPLTSDSNTISNMVPTLSTQIMPVLGSRPEVGISKAIELLKNAKHSRGQIIWLTDGVESNQTGQIISLVESSGYQLSILAIGTEQGAPIPLPNGNGFLKDSSGSIVVPKLEVNELKTIADSLDAGFVSLTADQSDIDYLQEYLALQNEDADSPENQDQKISKWIDDGYWIVWIVILLFLVKIIRQPSGSLASISLGAPLVLLLSSLSSSPSLAAENDAGAEVRAALDAQAAESKTSGIGQFWNDLWLTRDQQAQNAYREGDYQSASKLFESQDWKATSEYKQGNFAEAAQGFTQADSERDLYNRATALAKAQQLQESLETYNQLLEKNPEHQDGLYNKKIVEELLKQQQEQEQQDQQSDQDKQNEESQDSQSQDQNQQQEDQNSDQQQEQKDQKEQSEQESQEQQESEQQKQDAEMSEDERDKSEKDQALEHWLEKIPDDPGGLLRRKMYREYQRRGRQQKEEKLW